VLVGNREAGPSGSDSGGLLADLLEGARRRNLSANSLAAYERTWTRFLAWTAAASFDPRSLPFPDTVSKVIYCRGMVHLYAIGHKIKLFASPEIVDRAKEVTEAIIATYYAPSRKFTRAEEITGHKELDVLGAFSESCRADLGL
jgi:hypothetical protein